MKPKSLNWILFRSVIGIVIVASVLAILRSPLGSILFSPAGNVIWPSFTLFLLIEMTFISILVGDENAWRGLALKTVILAGLVLLFVSNDSMSWLTALISIDSSASAVAVIPDAGMRINEIIAVLNVPQIMLFLFGLWFFRTALWPALSR